VSELNSRNKKEFSRLDISFLLKNKVKKLRYKYPPIMKMVKGTQVILKIKRVYSLIDDFKNLYLFKVKSRGYKRKKHYILAISLASQSSDLLVMLARKLIKKIDSLRLIQFPIIPKHFRVNLMAIKEIDLMDDASEFIKILQEVRKEFRSKLSQLYNSHNK